MNIFKNSVLFNTLGLFKTERGMVFPVRDEGIMRMLSPREEETNVKFA